MKKAFERGIAAYILGLSINNNPYDKEWQPNLYEEWKRGFYS